MRRGGRVELASFANSFTYPFGVVVNFPFLCICSVGAENPRYRYTSLSLFPITEKGRF